MRCPYHLRCNPRPAARAREIAGLLARGWRIGGGGLAAASVALCAPRPIASDSRDGWSCRAGHVEPSCRRHVGRHVGLSREGWSWRAVMASLSSSSCRSVKRGVVMASRERGGHGEPSWRAGERGGHGEPVMASRREGWSWRAGHGEPVMASRSWRAGHGEPEPRVEPGDS